ncbi:MAG: flavin prenyltransferase UbiX [Thermoplasmataceae archaeon]
MNSKVEDRVVCITGASGSILGIRLLKQLGRKGTHLVISDSAKKVIGQETEYAVSEVEQLAEHVYSDKDIAARISSGSFRFSSAVIMPCSTSTLSRISSGIADSLITRVASVSIKERRKLILVPRETPLSTITLENMVRLSKAGVIIAPYMPAFYTKPKNVDDMVDFMVSRVLDLMDVSNELIRRWDGPE